MGLISSLETRQKPPWDDWWYSSAVGATNAGVDVSPKTALSSAAVWNALWMTAVVLGTIPLKLLRRTPAEKRVPAVDHPLYPLLYLKANRYMPAYRFRSTMQAWLFLFGNAVAQKVRNNREEITELIPLHPSRLEVFIDGDELKYLYRRPNGTSRAFKREEVLHVTGLSPDGILGWSPIEVNREALATTLATERHAAAYYKNSAKLAGILKVPGGGNLEAPKKKQLREEWQSAYSGDKAYSTAVLEYGLEFQEIGGSAKDAELLGNRTYGVQEVARISNIPPPFLMELSHGTFTNIETQALMLVKYTYNPWAVIWEQSIMNDLLDEEERETLFVKHNMSALLRGDSAARGQFHREMFNVGAKSPNDIRRDEDEDPYEGGDRYFVQMNMQPVDSVDAMLELDGEAGQQSDAEPRALPAGETREARQQRSIAGRRRHRQAFRGIFERTADRAVKREVRAARRALGRSGGKRDASTLREWMDSFYPEFGRALVSTFRPVFFSFAAEIAAEVAGELDSDEDYTPHVENFIRAYASAYGVRYVGKSRSELANALAAGTPAVALRQAEDVLDRWESTRPTVEANRETVRADGAVARAIYSVAGVSMRWTAFGSSCPFCTQLDGRIVSGKDPFLKPGDVLRGGAGQADLVVSGAKMHAPAHDGCDCGVVAAFLGT